MTSEEAMAGNHVQLVLTNAELTALECGEADLEDVYRELWRCPSCKRIAIDTTKEGTSLEWFAPVQDPPPRRDVPVNLTVKNHTPYKLEVRGFIVDVDTNADELGLHVEVREHVLDPGVN